MERVTNIEETILYAGNRIASLEKEMEDILKEIEDALSFGNIEEMRDYLKQVIESHSFDEEDEEI